MRGLLDFISRLVGDYQPDRPGLLLGQRLAAAVAGRPAAVVQGAPGGRRAADAPDIEEVPDPLEVQVPIILEVLDAFGICVVGADGYEADDVIGTLATGAGSRSTSSPATATCSSSSTTSADVRVLYIARGVGKHERVDQRLGARRSTASTPGSTPTSRPCAATPPTGCPAWPGVGEKTAATLLSGSATWTASSPPPLDPDSDMGPGPRGKIKAAADYLAVAPQVVAVARDIDLGTARHQALPAEPR